MSKVASYDPDTVVSMWGINDLIDEAHPVSEVTDAYRDWFGRARAEDPGVDFVVAELPQTWLFGYRVAQFNDALRALAAELSTPESLVVVAESHTLTRGDFWDDVHPAESGERRIATMIEAALADLERLRAS